ncbi:integrase core domain-containing protein, partial [Actinomyces naeslundii]|uniref:integrase core domain-containing protein n=1 Tax=Actinomyces naeslundii TaxID=1655 RepID=UPI001C4A903D
MAGPALPRPGGGSLRAVQETTGDLETVRLPRPQRLLAAQAPPSTSSPKDARRSSPRLQDDHSRLAVASLVASSETSQAAIDVFDKGVAARGVPQRLLTDNGIALNPSRRGCTGRLVEHVRSLGVEPITSKPYHPTTQGKNERFHQTLFRYLDQQPLAASIAELQEQVDRFDLVYNTQRPHQGLPGRITPQQAWDATEVAQAPRPDHDTAP